MTERSDDLRETEHWFVTRGLPHFIESYSAGRDVWIRALPVLILLFLAGVVAALESEWAWWQNGLAALGGLVLLISAWAIANRLRGRPALAVPTEVGNYEIAVFCLGPALLPLALGFRVDQALITLAVSVSALAVVYLVTSYGLVPMTLWAFGRAVRQTSDLASLLTRAMPLLLLIVIVLFLTAEVWQSTGLLHGPSYPVTLGLLAAVGITFVSARIPHEVGELNHFDPATLRAIVAATPACGLLDCTDQPLEAAPLSKRQWFNIGLVLLFSQAMQVVLVGLLLLLFFTCFGVAAISLDTVEAWIGGEANVFETWTFGGHTFVLTEEHLRVAGFLASFSALQFAIVAQTDAAYRADFHEHVVAEVREALAVRALYVTARAS